MQPRIDYLKLSQEPFKAMAALEKYFHGGSAIELMLCHLVKLRTSQINGCAYCIDMHVKDLIASGETTQRICGLNAWRESPFYTDRERAALEWTEAVTLISQTHADDATYERVKSHFSDKEFTDLTWIIAIINAWNRLAISMRTTPGAYQPARPAKSDV